MRDAFFVLFLFSIFVLGVRRPFIFVLGYVYIDIVSPQRLAYYLLASVPISLIFVTAAVGGWALGGHNYETRLAPRQVLILALLAWAGWTTMHADFPIDALAKWDWVWKSLVFAMFLPFTLKNRLRLDALLTFMVLSASSIIVTGGIKTLAAGGGYGVLNLGVDNNSGLYEGSIISTLAIAIIPIILYLRKYGTVFPKGKPTTLYACALIMACLIIPVGTEARTGLICILALVALFLRDAKRRVLYACVLAGVSLAAIPLLPASFTTRMDSIEGYQSDQSASTRIAVWQWTWKYLQAHPLGGGFEAYRQNSFSYETVTKTNEGDSIKIERTKQTDASRAYHSAYFEMLGEQGWPGFIIWITLHLVGLFRMEVLRRRYRRETGERAWIPALATTIQSSHLIYLVGSTFLGIAFQSFAFMWMGVEMSLDRYCRRIRRAEQDRPWLVRSARPAGRVEPVAPDPISNAGGPLPPGNRMGLNAS